MMADSLYHTLPDLIESIGQDDFYSEVGRSFLHIPTVLDIKVFSYPKCDKPAFLAGSSDPKHDELYCDYAYLLDPFYDFIQRQQRKEIVSLDSIKRPDFHTSTYYDRFYHMTGWSNESNFIVDLHDEQTVCVAYTVDASTRSEINDELRPYLQSIKSAIRTHELMSTRAVNTGQSDETLASESATPNEGQMEALGLTKREKEIVQYILQGHASSQIADMCYVSEGTIKNHRKNIYRKLKIHSQGELFRKFLN